MIIAECGLNHRGNIDLAFRMIDEAKNMGADLVKFQLYDTDSLHAKDSPLYDAVKQAELTKKQAFELFNYGKEIEVFFSVFDIERVKWCEEMGVRKYKISSRVQGVKLIEAVCGTHKPIILSVAPPYIYPQTAFIKAKRLYCISEYPTHPISLHFNTIDFHTYGFSDHTIGLDCAKIALSRGAEIIEKHFSLDHKTGVDAEWSMTPDELRELKRFENVVREAL